jgi:hypothetical protein
MAITLALIIAPAWWDLRLRFACERPRQAEEYAWAWMIYLLLGVGMIFGATSVEQPLLSAFMWTKLTAFIVTGGWLFSGRLRRREALFPGFAGRQAI